MADRYSRSDQTQGIQASAISRLVQKLQERAPSSGKLIGLLAILITGMVLLLLTGLTITVTVISLIFFTPLIIISSPIWVPLGIAVFLATAAIFSTCGFAVAFVAGSSWIFKYFRGYLSAGSDRIDYDYPTEYGGYLQNKVKDAAPGA